MDMFPLIVLLFFGSCFLIFALAFGAMLALILVNARRASQRRLVDASRFDFATGAVTAQMGDVYDQQTHHTHHHTPDHPPIHHHAPMHTGMTHTASHTTPPPSTGHL